MAVQSPHLKYQVDRGVIEHTKLISENNYYNQKNYTPAQLTTKLIYMIGKERNIAPLATRLIGSPYFDIAGTDLKPEQNPFDVNTSVTRIEDNEYTYPVMTRTKNGSDISRSLYSGGDKPGVGGLPFKIPFKTKALHKHFIIQSPKGIQVRVEDYAVEGDDEMYTVVMTGVTADQFCPLSELKEGVNWINMFPAVPEVGSRTIDMGRIIKPSTYKNQLITMRSGLTFEGDVDRKMAKYVTYTDKKPDGSFVMDGSKPAVKWVDQYTYNYEIDNLNMIEAAMWYMRNNRNNGLVTLKDTFTSRPISIGSGLIEQILNKATYTNLTYKFLSDLIGQAFFGIRDARKTITLYTGTLGMRKFDRAMKLAGKEMLTDWGFIADKFVTGNDYGLMLGGYFDGFYQIDGYIIKVKKTEIFDNGIITNSPIDEESGLPTESARMVFLDDGDYDGQNNIQMILKKGYEPFTHAVIRGMNNLPDSIKVLTGKLDSDKIIEVSTDMDRSSYTRKYAMGIQMLRGNTSFDLQYAPFF